RPWQGGRGGGWGRGGGGGRGGAGGVGAGRARGAAPGRQGGRLFQVLPAGGGGGGGAAGAAALVDAVSAARAPAPVAVRSSARLGAAASRCWCGWFLPGGTRPVAEMRSPPGCRAACPERTADPPRRRSRRHRVWGSR